MISDVLNSPIRLHQELNNPSPTLAEPSKCKDVALKALENKDEPSPHALVDKTITEFLPSEDGVPTYNNLNKFIEYDELRKQENPPVEEETVLNKLIKSFRPNNLNSTTEELRKATIEQIREIMRAKLITVEQLNRQYDHPETLEFLKKLGLLSPSTATLLLVHLILFGVPISRLGTKKHWDAYLDRINNLDIIGCCMFTEFGRPGSEVTEFGTTATFDKNTREFIIHTPTNKSMKAFIGGAAQNATHGVLFARLIIEKEDFGVHAFVVEMRRNGQNLPGIITQDMGRKHGLNGVDNAYVRFDHHRIPYDNLLDHYAEISSEGEYIAKNGNTKEKSKNLIYKMMSNFVRGRQTIAFNKPFSFLSCVFCCYPPPIGKVRLDQLMVKFLSRAYAMEFAMPIYLGKHIEDHINASLMKAVSSEMGMAFFDEVLSLYGSNPHTYHIRNVIQSYRDDCDATKTYEGDNNLLLQLVAKDILSGSLKDFTNLTNLDFSFSGIKAKASASVSVIKKGIQSQLPPPHDPYHLLKKRVQEYVNIIGLKMRAMGASKDNPGKALSIWNTYCQEDGVKMAKIYAQTLIINEFYKQAQILDAEQKTTKWSMLCLIYAWEICAVFMPEVKKPDLAQVYEALYPEIYDLMPKDMELKWLDALIPRPKHSRPFEEQEPAPYLLPDELFEAKL